MSDPKVVRLGGSVENGVMADQRPPASSDQPLQEQPPRLLRVPDEFHSALEPAPVAKVLVEADGMHLENVLVLSERADGRLVILDSGLTCARANWLLDRAKKALLDG